MVIYFANRKMDILGMASTELMEGFTISDDLKTEDTDTGVSTFECTIHWTDESRALAETATAAGNYLLRSYNYDNEFYTIIESVVDTKSQTIDIYAEDAGMDLLNGTVGAYSAPSAMPIADYVLMFTEDSGFEIGINEIENLSRTLSWEGEATEAERVASVATQFDNAEISFSFDIKELTITHKYINIHKKRGKDAGVQLRLNRDVDRIITTTSVADLATSLYVTGGIPEGSDDPITITGYDYDDGDMYVMAEESRLNSRDALAVWSRYVWAKEPGQIEGYTGHIVKQWSYDTTSVSELVNRAITQLKKVCEPAVNYEIDIQQLPENVGIGDYVDIVDEKGELYLSSRILKLTTSACNKKQTATLGEFLIKEGGISETVRELADQFSQLAKTRQYYVWIAYADDEFGNGISLDPTGKTYMGTCTTTAGAEVDISDPSVFTWALIQGNGVETINTYYGTSDSPTVVPDVWYQNDPPEVLQNEYLWTYTETIYTNGVVELTSPHIMAYYNYLEVDELVAQVANIESLLAGNIGTGTLQTVHLTGDNAVIDEAVIVNAVMGTAVADLLVSSKIYTDYVEIANNTEENGQYLLIDHSTIQINDGTYTRVQIGEDAEGDYNLYLWDDAGAMLWNAKGLTESGVSGNGGIIKNVAVADDAAIAGHKLDIESVASELSEDGTLTIQAGNVYIGDDRLDYQLTDIEEQIAGLEGVTTDGIVYFYPVYALGVSDTEPPLDNDANSICGECICGEAICGAMGSVWTEEEPTQIDGYYLWMKYICVYSAGTTEETVPILITDSFLRSTTKTIQTSLEVMDGEIQAVVAQTTIIGNEMEDMYAYIDETVGSIILEVGDIIYDLDNVYATKASLVLQLDPDTHIATMTAEADYIRLTSGQLIIESDGFSLTEDGYLIINAANFTLDASGYMVAKSGTIGGWTIGETSIYNNLDELYGDSAGTYIGTDGICQRSDDLKYSFRLTDGQITGSFLRIESSTAEDESSLWIGTNSYGCYFGNTRNYSGSNAESYLALNTGSGSGEVIICCYVSTSLQSNISISSSSINITSSWIFINGTVDALSVTTLTASGRVTFSSYLTVSRAVTIGSDLDVSGATTISSTLTTTGNITCGSDSSTNQRSLIIQNSYRELRLIAATNGDGGLAVRIGDSTAWLFVMDSSSIIYLSNNSYPTVLRGSSVTLSTTGGAAVTSDRQMKDNITPFDAERTDELSDGLTPRIYTAKDDPTVKHIGFVVDEVEAAMEAAGYDPEEYGLTTRYIDDDGEEIGAIRYDEFIPILLYEIQELRDRVNALENPEEGLIDPGIQLN